MTTEKELLELDVFCAEHVMRWRLVKRDLTKDNDFIVHGGVLRRISENSSLQHFRPTTKPADALAVLEKCAQKIKNTTFQIAIAIDPDNDFFIVTLDSCKDEDNSVCVKSCATAPTLQGAIARFARALYSQGEPGKKEGAG